MNDVTENLVEEYEITPYTLMVKPVTYGGKTHSHIFEMDDEYISPFRPIDIIKKSCNYFGTSYEGRKEGTRQLIGITHKAPIAINPTSSMFFFPTTSPLRPQCIWVSLEHIDTFNRADNSHTSVLFKNHLQELLPISTSSFENQYMRTVILKDKLIQRIEETDRKYFYLHSSTRPSKASERHSNYTRYKKFNSEE
ncbi:transcriptional regulator [Peribacillus cavernae]|uniref:Transcriptional regulator n=1 Tax=Peribacillus cavernae TaxID=1674310 RepID=A0A433HNT3_9BACI|nr:competence protein ComK [Peribacillus cavernae]MDQ0217579.1 competence protein ComK [Peribacillus cavernae]RUQ29987.1 transcriptional regulator [Peribacillus cavernae]